MYHFLFDNSLGNWQLPETTWHLSETTLSEIILKGKKNQS